MAKQKVHGPSGRRGPEREGWVHALRFEATGEPRYLTIANALAAAVERGELAPGDRLPPQRRVAEALGVDLTTVTRAYAQARSMGVLEGETGRGTFVRGAPTPAGPLVDLSMNLPPSPADTNWRDLIARGVSSALRDNDAASLMTYRAGLGTRRDKLAGAAWLAPLLGAMDETRIFLAPGAQGAIAALLPMLALAGDCILAEPFTYPGFLAAARVHGVNVASLACDAEGPAIAALEAQIKKLRPRALYLNPTLQNPTARTISAARRDAIAAIAQKHSILILEDDPYGLLGSHETPLAARAPEHAIYVATLSKTIIPGLRTAFVVAPSRMTERVAEALRASYQMPPPLLSDMAVRWIESGTAKQLLNGVITESAARMKIARVILPRAEGGPLGFHLWMRLPAHWDADAYSEAARAQGVVTVPSRDFATEKHAEFFVRISLGAPPDRDSLARGLRALAALEKP
jgi:DNA-binding transcriptional MocR family regulator